MTFSNVIDDNKRIFNQTKINSLVSFIHQLYFNDFFVVEIIEFVKIKNIKSQQKQVEFYRNIGKLILLAK